MNQPTVQSEGRAQTIIAYVLFGVLVALYPAKLGYDAIVRWIGPEKVYYNSCWYKVVESPYVNGQKQLEPLDDTTKVCEERNTMQTLEEFCEAGAKCSANSKAIRKLRELPNQ